LYIFLALDSNNFNHAGLVFFLVFRPQDSVAGWLGQILGWTHMYIGSISLIVVTAVQLVLRVYVT